MHIVAENHSVRMLDALFSNTRDRNEYTDYTAEDLAELLSEPVSAHEPYKTPLYFAFPRIDLCDTMISHGADVHCLSFLHCYFTYRKQVPRHEQQDFYKYISNLVVQHGLDVNETDVNGRNCIAIVYQDLRDDPLSVDPQAKLNYYEVHFLKSIGSSVDLRCLDDPQQGRTALLDAAYKGRVDLFSYLLAVGADPDARCVRGKSLSDHIKMDFSETLKNKEYFVKNSFITNQLNKMLYKYTLTQPMRSISAP